jgi:hypothetical protein
MIASNFLFNFIPKELHYVKNNSSKHELKLSATARATYIIRRHVTEIAGVLCTAYSTEGLIDDGHLRPKHVMRRRNKSENSYIEDSIY